MRHPPNTPGEWLLLLGICAGLVFSIFAFLFFLLIVGPWIVDRFGSHGPQDEHEQRLFQESAEFRSRWQHVQLWQVPYAELACEASRCGQIISILEKRRTGPMARPANDELINQISWYRTTMTTIQQAMAYVTAHGGEPQLPPHGTGLNYPQ
ncbi:hypothetical protein A5779_17775 [Mycolicibacterium peregrinum]|uniref:Uncharacterized protein n=1 Tax=Mycolicibacterium peregrinum TaxID=43304 RepID=A0A1A0WDG4_MYCPR|nr:hypothetical protein A5779_17775 [Mycolicibacterium peregrinum]